MRMQTKRKSAEMTVDTIIKFVDDYGRWFRMKVRQLGYLNPSVSAEDLQQEFIAHALQYDLVGRFDPTRGTKPTTYLHHAVQAFVNAKFRERYSSQKRRPKGGNVFSLGPVVDSDDDELGGLDIEDESPDHVTITMAVDCLDTFRAGLVDRGDGRKLDLFDEIIAANGDLSVVARARKTQPWVIRQKLNRIANTPIGRFIREEFLGN